MATEESVWPLSKKTFCLITGASRGLGKALAIEIGSRLGDDSVMVLLARDMVALRATECGVLERRPAGVRVHLEQLDLSVPNGDAYAATVERALGAETGSMPADYDAAVIVHNAGSTGTPNRAINYDDPTDWAAYLAFNVTSPVCINCVFLRRFSKVKRKLVVNISSLAGVRASPGLAMYCAGKAARNLYFSTLAAEEADVTVLNYAPGPLRTQMYYDVIENSRVTCGDLGTAEKFQKRIDDGLVLTCETTTARLLRILESGRFTSGAHIDYYDEH